MKIKTIFAWIILSMIGFLPAVLLFIFGPDDYSSLSHTFGQISGLIGMTFFALTFTLSTRARWIEKLFDGLDKMYPVHAVFGSLSLVLLLLHPLFLVFKFIPENFKLAATYLVPGGLLSVDFGIFALAGMIILLFVSLYSNMAYHRWKMTHEFLGLFFILAVLHVFLVRIDVARDSIFQGYFVYAAVVSAIGLGSFGYSMFRTFFLVHEYLVKSIRYHKDAYEIYLEPKRRPIKYRTGQFIFVKFFCKGVARESHPFSIASAEGNLRIFAKNLGDYTSSLGNLEEGSRATVEGPYGCFHQKWSKKEVWVAGGIGVTPFLSLANDIKENKVDMYYSVKDKEELIGLNELNAIAKKNKNFRIFPWLSCDRGHICVDDIENIAEMRNAEYYLCGPERLKNSIRQGLIQKKIPKHRIHEERFAFK